MAFKYTGFADEAGQSLEEQIAVVKMAGWNSIEVRALDIGHFCDLSEAQWDATWATLQAEGISVPGFGGQIGNWARPITADFEQDIAELKRVAPRMRQTDAACLRVMSYPNDEQQPWSDTDWKQEAFRRLRELAKMAEDLGVVLGHENCSGYGSQGPAECLEMVEAIDSPAFKLIFDTGNDSLHHHDGEATWRLYEACREHVIHVHIKSARPGDDGTYATCYPDEDPIQARILADLKARDYDGWVSIEPHLHAQIHAGEGITDEVAARTAWVEYARRLEALVGKVG
jgi:L-ribulose-5-phosphate 3-epimerase